MVWIDRGPGASPSGPRYSHGVIYFVVWIEGSLAVPEIVK